MRYVKADSLSDSRSNVHLVPTVTVRNGRLVRDPGEFICQRTLRPARPVEVTKAEFDLAPCPKCLEVADKLDLGVWVPRGRPDDAVPLFTTAIPRLDRPYCRRKDLPVGHFNDDPVYEVAVPPEYAATMRKRYNSCRHRCWDHDMYQRLLQAGRITAD